MAKEKQSDKCVCELSRLMSRYEDITICLPNGEYHLKSPLNIGKGNLLGGIKFVELSTKNN